MNKLNKFHDIQYHEGDKLTFTNQERHTVNTTHNMAIYSNPYRSTNQPTKKKKKKSRTKYKISKPGDYKRE